MWRESVLPASLHLKAFLPSQDKRPKGHFKFWAETCGSWAHGLLSCFCFLLFWSEWVSKMSWEFYLPGWFQWARWDRSQTQLVFVVGFSNQLFLCFLTFISLDLNLKSLGKSVKKKKLLQYIFHWATLFSWSLLGPHVLSVILALSPLSRALSKFVSCCQ